MELLLWFESNALGLYIREDLWAFPIALSVHAVGMAMVLGIVMLVNFRVLGYVKAIPVLSYSGLFGVAWAGFALNLISGLALYSAHATEYTFQLVFILKIGLLVLGGILMKVMLTGIRDGWDQGKIKMVSVVCLLSWVGAVITGRLMAYA